MKADVVVSFYRKPQFWERLITGLVENRAHIGKVIVVNDEPWSAVTLPSVKGVGALDLVFLDHPHDGWGAAKSVNQGAAAVETEFFIHIDRYVHGAELCRIVAYVRG
jgi:hypothetical protein